jgi:hypothetical protein
MTYLLTLVGTGLGHEHQAFGVVDLIIVLY